MNSVVIMRRHAGLTQKELAERAQTNIRWIQKVESGEISIENITLKKALALIRALSRDDDPAQNTLKDAYAITREMLEEREPPKIKNAFMTVLDTLGPWEDSRDVETIIAEIYDSRTPGRTDISL